jgi:DMSO/TMAO reductase YedYZ molybdopterin-dependent catalytic subunit
MSRLKEYNTPVFWVEGHPGTLDRDDWKIEVRGLCEHPQVFTWQDLMALPKTIADARLTSVTRFSVRGRWGGVRLGHVLAAAGCQERTSFVRFWSVRRVYNTSMPIKVALMEKTLLAYEFDGEYLEEDYGGPVRGFVPYLWGYKSAKSVVRLELMDHYESGFWESRGYADDAFIEAGLVRDMNEGGRIRRIPDGEVIQFLDP